MGVARSGGHLNTVRIGQRLIILDVIPVEELVFCLGGVVGKPVLLRWRWCGQDFPFMHQHRRCMSGRAVKHAQACPFAAHWTARESNALLAPTGP